MLVRGWEMRYPPTSPSNFHKNIKYIAIKIKYKVFVKFSIVQAVY